MTSSLYVALGSTYVPRYWHLCQLYGAIAKKLPIRATSLLYKTSLRPVSYVNYIQPHALHAVVTLAVEPTERDDIEKELQRIVKDFHDVVPSYLLGPAANARVMGSSEDFATLLQSVQSHGAEALQVKRTLGMRGRTVMPAAPRLDPDLVTSLTMVSCLESACSLSCHRCADDITVLSLMPELRANAQSMRTDCRLYLQHSWSGVARETVAEYERDAGGAAQLFPDSVLPPPLSPLWCGSIAQINAVDLAHADMEDVDGTVGSSSVSTSDGTTPTDSATADGGNGVVRRIYLPESPPVDDPSMAPLRCESCLEQASKARNFYEGVTVPHKHYATVHFIVADDVAEDGSSSCAPTFYAQGSTEIDALIETVLYGPERFSRESDELWKKYLATCSDRRTSSSYQPNRFLILKARFDRYRFNRVAVLTQVVDHIAMLTMQQAIPAWNFALAGGVSFPEYTSVTGNNVLPLHCNFGRSLPLLDECCWGAPSIPEQNLIKVEEQLGYYRTGDDGDAVMRRG